MYITKLLILVLISACSCLEIVCDVAELIIALILSDNCDLIFIFYRVQVFLWLSSGPILKRKDKLEGHKKHSLKRLIYQILILNINRYLEPCQWVMFPHIMVMVIRLVLL